jgi:leishmanolysin
MLVSVLLKLAIHSRVCLREGWYQANFTRAQKLDWGNGKGCSFVQQRCSLATWGAQYFCAAANQEGCSADLRYRGVCNLATFGSALSPAFQYFANPNTGGQMPYADYCPYYHRYSNGDCWSSSTTGYFGYGEKSLPGSPGARCFAGTFLLGAFGTTSPRHSACLDFTCNAQSLVVVKLVGQSGTTSVICPADGGDVNLATVAGSEFIGTITCPPKIQLCSGNPCDNQQCSGHGVCNPASGSCTCDSRCDGCSVCFVLRGVGMTDVLVCAAMTTACAKRTGAAASV